LKLINLILVLFLCAGCDSVKSEWQTAPLDYNCTTEQMIKAQNEAGWCQKNTDYFGAYCYGTAIIRNCKKTEAIRKGNTIELLKGVYEMHFIRLNLTTGVETTINMHHVYEMRPTNEGGTVIFFTAPTEGGNEAIRVVETVEEIMSMC